MDSSKPVLAQSDEPRGLDDAEIRLKSKHLQIRTALVRQLYSQGQQALVGALLGAVLLVAALWTIVPQFLLIMWLGGYALTCVFRQVLLTAYKRSDPPLDQEIWWERRLAVSIFSGAFFWGLAGVLLFPSHSIPHQFLLALFVTGISCGAVMGYWSCTSCYVPAILVELLPLAVRFIYEGNEVHMTVGTVIPLFAIVLIVMGSYLHSMNIEVLESRFDKSDLADFLQKAHNDLELKVEQRTAELTQLNEKLRESEEKYRILVEKSLEGISVAQDGLLRFVNAAAVEIVGYDENELLSRPLIQFIHPDDRDLVLQQHLRRLKGEKFPSRYSFRIVRKDGQIRWVEIDSGLISWDKKPAALFFLTDITERKEAEWALELARDELEDIVRHRTSQLVKANELLELEIAERLRAEEELRASHERLELSLAATSKLRNLAEAASDAKTKFLANMSHELRTPLTAVIGFSELLEGQMFGKLNEKQLVYVREIFTAGHHLLRLINDILDLAKVESGKMDLQISRLRLGQLLHDCFTMIQKSAMKHNQVLEQKIPEDLAETVVLADEIKLKQVLVNLLSNAAKFTPSGGTITVEAERKDDEIFITVADTGLGIKPEDQQRIFEAFEQVDRSFSRMEQGTGLGLALVRRLVELHGGQIWVESAGLGKGSTFRVVIPFIEAGEEKEEQIQRLRVPETVLSGAAQEFPEQDQARTKVLVVEDHEASMRFITNLLQTKGYTVLKAFSAEEGIRIAENESPALILMDISLPGMDGLTATRVLKNNDSTAHIPVVALTAHAMQNDGPRAENAGCDAYLTKPIDIRAFFKTLARLVKTSEGKPDA